tara:strand:+ start:4403 stop:6562 length:2160 start_codon:yes stop_codon:yes gene_type:complete
MADSDVPTKQFGHDIKINSIIIGKMEVSEGGVIPGFNIGNALQIYPNPEGLDEADPLLGSFTITSSIFTPGMIGKLKFRDPGTMGEAFNINATEYVLFDVETPGNPDSKKQIKMCVEDVHHVGDMSSEQLSGKGSKQGIGWELNLIPCESYLQNWDDLNYQKDGFIGKIASDVPWETSGEKGLVNQIFDKYFSPGGKYSTYYGSGGEGASENKIENTLNTVWLKKNHNLYPWGKDVSPPNLLQLLNSLTEYAVTDEPDSNGVNYVFYQDMDGWHFKSIRSILREASGFIGEDDSGDVSSGLNKYYITDFINIPTTDENTPNYDPKIYSLISFNEWNHLSSWVSGAYSCYYELVKPNYSDPYFDYMDTTSIHQRRGANEWGDREIITYDYHRDSQKWGDIKQGGRVEEYKLLADPSEDSIWDTSKTYESRKHISNPIFGYFSPAYNKQEELPYDFMGSEYTQGKYGKTNDKIWQTMHDCTDLEAKNLWTIQNKIKKPVRQNYKQYVEKKNLKEKWNVYRHSICCDKENIEKYQFLAVIDDAKLVQDNDRGGIYNYSWREVEMWPTDDIETMNPDSVVLTDEEAPITIATVPGGMEGNIEDEATMTAAWNINELFNSMEGDNVFVGPGINVADDDFNDYPEAYQMMPVGGYFKIDDNPCEVEDGADVYFHKHLVQMYKLPMYVLEGMTTTGDVENNFGDEPVEIFFFDVPNAHDGLCDCPS